MSRILKDIIKKNKGLPIDQNFERYPLIPVLAKTVSSMI